MSKQTSNIKLETQVELLGLDKVNDATQIFEIKQKSLQRQIEVGNQKLKIMAANLQDVRERTGENSAETQKAEESYNRARLAVGKLQVQLKNLVKQQEQAAQSANKSGVNYKKLFESIGVRVGGSDNFALFAKLGELKEAFPALEGGITKFTNALSAIPAPAKAAALAIAAIPVAVKATESALLSMAEPAITAGDLFYVASRGAQMTLKDFEELATICKVTGINLDEVTSVMKRLNMQIVKGGDSAALKTLKKYGVEVRNVNGEMKNALEMSKALSEGLERARAKGVAKEFIAGTFGKQATGDIVTYLEDLKGNVELAKTIVRNGLFDPERAHNVQGEINAMNRQAEELGGAFSSALLPIAEEVVPHITKRFGEMTKVIENNAEGIKEVAFAIAEVVNTVGDLTAKTVELGANAIGTAGNIMTSEKRQFIKEYGTFTKEIKTEKDLMERELAKMLPTQRAALIPNSPQMALFESKIHQQFKNMQKWREENIKSWADFRRADEEATKQYTANQAKKIDEEEEELRKVKNYAAEIQKLKLEFKFGNDDYSKSLVGLSQWYAQEIQQVEGHEKLKTELTELYSLKRAEIEKKHRKETLDRLKQLTEETEKINFDRTHTAFESQIRDIEKWKFAQLEKAKTAKEVSAIIANAAAKEAKAFEDEIKTIQGLNLSIQEKIFELKHSERDKDILRAQKEFEKNVMDGGDFADAYELYRLQVGKAYQDAAENPDRNKKPRVMEMLPDYDDNFLEQLYQKVDEATARHKIKLEFDNIDAPQFDDLSPKISTDNISKQLSMLEGEPLKFKANLEDLNSSISQSLKISTSYFESGLTQAAQAIINFETTLTTAAGKLSKLEFPDLKSENNFTARSSQTNNEDFWKPKFCPPKFELPKTELPKITLPKTDTKVFDGMAKEMANIAAKISELTRTAGTIARNVDKARSAPANVTVAPNMTISLNLSGSYILTESMVNQLAAQATEQVANGVTDAVTRATQGAEFQRLFDRC